MQSALDPAGHEAHDLASLFYIMLAGAAVIFAVVMALAIYATRIRPDPHEIRVGRMVIILGGFVVPFVVLTALLVPSLALMPEHRAPGGPLRIEVEGLQWWWRVTYHSPDLPAPVVSANEVRLPTGQRVELTLSSPDVIHSLWIPPLAGKVDMIPGRVNRLVVEPTRTGTFRGVCAEFCGTSHALMAFGVAVSEPLAFATWLAEEAAPAVPPADDAARRGAELFTALGCGGCHAVRGTAADGTIGPDLTHVGRRLSLGAGILPNDRASLIRWIAHTDEVKPEVRMPAFGMLAQNDLEALATYLGGLR